ncbi:unnamed protein product, partial [Rotaria sordida]
MTARRVVSVEPQKLDIIQLIEQLNNSDIEQIIDYTKKWITKRDEFSNRKEEKDS